jgi:hypothetical protein
MRGSLLDSVIRGFGRRIAWVAVVLVVAGVSAGARLVWNQMNPSSKTITIPEAKSTAAAGSRSANGPVASSKPGPAVATPAPGAAPSAHPVTASAKAPANAVPGKPTSNAAPSNAAQSNAAAGSAVAAKPGANATAAKPGAPAPAVAYGPPAPVAPATPAGLKASPASALTPAVTSRPVSATRAPNATPAPGAPTSSHLDEQLTYQYETVGRRDPFQPIVGGAFVGADVGGDAPMDIGGVKVVGVVWGSEDKFAMVEDARGQSNVLRVGDRIQNGVVTGLKKDGVIVTLTVDGQSQTVTIPLTKKGDQSNANR